jgi:hypothetical protein
MAEENKNIRLPRFENEKALIIVTGFEIGKFYLAEKGHMRELSFFRVHPPDYRAQNQEENPEEWDYFDTQKKNWRQRDFFRNLKDTVRVITDHEKPGTIYLFAPKEILRKTKKTIPFLERPKLQMAVPENFVMVHPYGFLERIYLERQRHPKVRHSLFIKWGEGLERLRDQLLKRPKRNRS